MLKTKKNIIDESHQDASSQSYMFTDQRTQYYQYYHSLPNSSMDAYQLQIGIQLNTQ